MSLITTRSFWNSVTWSYTTAEQWASCSQLSMHGSCHLVKHGPAASMVCVCVADFIHVIPQTKTFGLVMGLLPVSEDPRLSSWLGNQQDGDDATPSNWCIRVNDYLRELVTEQATHNIGLCRHRRGLYKQRSSLFDRRGVHIDPSRMHVYFNRIRFPVTNTIHDQYDHVHSVRLG